MQEHLDLELSATALGLDSGSLLAALEGLLFAAGTEGLTDRQIARVFSLPETSVPSVCVRLAARQADEGRMLRAVRIADAWQLVTAPALAPFLRELALAPPPAPLSQAALETLAIVAYRQPVTRAQIEDLRGVKSERALGTLIARDLVRELGRSEKLGRPILYGTTKEFLAHFGLSSAADLPPLDNAGEADSSRK